MSVTTTVDTTEQTKPRARLARRSGPSVRNWQPPTERDARKMRPDTAIDMGWGRILFGHTFSSSQTLVDALTDQNPDRRDIALYLRDPHVVLSLAPHRLFLDPSHTYRLWADRYKPSARQHPGVTIRRITSAADAEAANLIYAARKMVTADPSFMLDEHASKLRSYFIAEVPGDPAEGEPPRKIVGTATGVDHVEAFGDPENGASLWCLAVDPQCQTPGVGESLVRQVIEYHLARGRAYIDLSVMHDSAAAIKLYEKLGFKRVPAFCVKQKNPVNEKLFTAPAPDMGGGLNPYAKIIVDEALRRGLRVEVIDAAEGYFSLTHGARTVVCRESLTELTSAVAMSRCDNKVVTRRLLESAGLRVPAQITATDPATNEAFLAEHGKIVVKPARGEQGHGIAVGLTTPDAVRHAIEEATKVSDRVLLEQMVEGEDLRVIVIDGEVVAAAIRRPPVLTGTGEHSIHDLIAKYSRRRAAATGGESRVPMDAETDRCVAEAGYSLDDVLPAGEHLRVRHAANLHTGGTIHDVTAKLHPTLRDACIVGAKALDIPVTGLDLIVPDVENDQYYFIEANERPGLANHEPQPTAERFIDFLFPQTAAQL